MLLKLQRYSFDFVYRPGSELVIAETLSRAYPPTHVSRANNTKFTAELAAMDEQHLQELRTVASQQTIDLIHAAAAEDDEYDMLKAQIAVGWPDAAASLPEPLRTRMSS